MELTDLIAFGKDAPTLLVLAVLIWRLEARLARIEKVFEVVVQYLIPGVKKK